jgi:hypothetical protein
MAMITPPPRIGKTTGVPQPKPGRKSAGALENEQRKTYDEDEVKDMVREHLRLPPDAEMIWQTDGSLLVIWTPLPERG